MLYPRLNVNSLLETTSLSALAQCARNLPRSRRLWVSSLALFLVLSVSYTASIDLRASRGASITGDEPFYLLTTQSILQDGDLDLTQQYESQSYRSFFDHPQGLWRQSVARDDGMLLSPHSPGLSVILLPGFAAAGLLGAQVQLLMMSALTFTLAYLLAVRITGQQLYSWVAVIVVGLGASSLVYSTEVYPEMPAALVLVASLLLVTTAADRLKSWRILLLAAALSLVVWLGVKYAPLAGLVAVGALCRMDRRQQTLFLTVGVLSAAFFLWFHLETFGALTPYSVGVVYAGDSSMSVLGQHFAITDRVYRLAGLFLDQRFGVGRWSPVLLLAAPSLAYLWYRGTTARLTLTLIVTQLFIATFLAITMMGWWFPGRTLMTVVPLLAVPLAILLGKMNRWGRLVFLSLAVYSLGVTIALIRAVREGEVTTAVDPFNLSASIFHGLAPAFPNYTYWSVETWLLTAIWVGSGSVALAMVFKSLGNEGFPVRSSVRRFSASGASLAAPV